MREDDEEFENEVRRIGRALWPSDQYSGAMVVDGRERDGVFETEECIHLVEATTSRKLEKARQDVGKLVSLANKLQKKTTTKAVRCWFVTRDEPTADQRGAAEKHRHFLNVLSFAQFQGRLIDSRAYLSCRDNHAFGSVRDPLTGGLSPAADYVPLALAEPGGAVVSPDDVIEGMRTGKRFVILGDYGAGKSMTLRYVYRGLRGRHLKGESVQFPVYINLSDHYGQSDPAEILERHARIIGFEQPAHLVRAWRAGYVHLLLDGFDEITTLSIQGMWRKLRDSRYRAMEPVRRIVAGHPPTLGLLLAGRAHFFDNVAERRTALGVGSEFRELSLSEFSDGQIHEFLGRHGLMGAIPAWLPSRPLLVAYLASRGLLGDVVGPWALDLGPAEGWNMLLDKISCREAQIETGIDGPTIRRILERLATKARSSQDGLGPITHDDIVNSFREVCGYPPDDRGMVLLQRLPGLGIDHGAADLRRFVDEFFAEACRAGDLVSFIENPYDVSGFPLTMDCAAGALGVAVAAIQVRTREIPAPKIVAAMGRATAQGFHYLASDVVFVAMETDVEIGTEVFIRDVLIYEAEFGPGIRGAGKVRFDDCLFGVFALDPETTPEKLPRFTRCYFGLVEGRVSARDLPSGVFEDCTFDQFASCAETTNDVLELHLSLGVRVLLTILKKLFEQKGRGRKENALYRGLDHRAKQMVPQILELLQSEKVAFPSRRGTETIWLPDRAASARAARILAAPSLKADALVVAASEVS